MRRRLVKCITIALAVLLLSACVPVAETSKTPKGKLVINEVMSQNKGYLYKSGTPDWIELYNAGEGEVNLSAYMLEDKSDNAPAVLPNVVLKPHEYILIYCDKDKTGEYGELSVDFALSAAGDMLTLYDISGSILQRLELPRLSADISFARRADGGYAYCAKPTANAANDDSALYDSLAMAETARQSALLTDCPIVINEVVSKCQGCAHCSCGKAADWAELYNPTDEPFSLDGFALANDVMDYGKLLAKGLIIEPHSYLVIYGCDCGAQDAADFRLSSSGATLYLLYGCSKPLLTLEIPALPTDMSFAHDAQGEYGYCLLPTPNAKNNAVSVTITPAASDRSGDLYISELAPKGSAAVIDAYGQNSDWAELYNPTDKTISTEGYFLSCDAKELLSWALPAVEIPPQGYLLVFLSGKTGMDGELHAPFRLSLGETLYLTNAQSYKADSITVPTDASGRTLGMDDNGTPVSYEYATPLRENSPHVAADDPECFYSRGVYINEVVAAHGAKSGENDWIELRNGGAAAVLLEGWFLTDSMERTHKWALSGSVEADGYFVFEAEDLGVSQSGETIYLINASGDVVDSFSSGVLCAGVSSGRLMNDNTVDRVFFTTPTKGAENSGAYCFGYTSQPVLSENKLYHDTGFALKISCATQGAVIYYTTDGSKPTVDSKRYTEPVEVSSSLSIRAAAFYDGLLPSFECMANYLFVEPHTVPVVCLTLDSSDFSVLYNVTERADIVERYALCSYYETNGEQGISFPCGLKAKGRGSLSYQQKSMTMKLRAAYGMDSVSYPFFDDYEFTEFWVLSLRCGGQDIDNAIIRDSLVSRAALGLNVDCGASRPVVVYVNGAYFGLYALIEEMNADYFTTHYGVSDDDMEVINQNRTAKTGTAEAFLAMRRALTHTDYSIDANFEELKRYVDVEAFTDYIIIQTLVGNTDVLNQKYARSTDGTLKWRPVLFDLDYAYTNSNSSILSCYLWDSEIRTSAESSVAINNDFFRALVQNEGWRQRFVERYVEIAYGAFDTDRISGLVDLLAGEIRPEMGRQVERWNMHSSVSAWENEIEQLKTCVQLRRDKALEELRRGFDLTREELDALTAQYSAKDGGGQ